MLNLPYPISTNRYWRVFRNRTVLSSEAKAYKAQVAAIAKQSGQTLHHDDVEILITVQRKANKDGSASRVFLDLLFIYFYNYIFYFLCMLIFFLL